MVVRANLCCDGGKINLVLEIIVIISKIRTASRFASEAKTVIRTFKIFYGVLNGHCCSKRVITNVRLRFVREFVRLLLIWGIDL